MPRPTAAILVALLAVTAAGPVAATADAPPASGAMADTERPTSDLAVSAVNAERPTGDFAVSAVDRSVQADDNLTVEVQLPRTVAANVTQNYSVDVGGADGTVTVEWSFDGETKRGQTVTHSWTDAGNATVAVTVTDADGDAVTRERTVTVVDYSDESEAGNPLDDVAAIALIIFMLGGVPLILLVFVVPKTMEVLTDSL
jgi:hypothetical protein